MLVPLVLSESSSLASHETECSLFSLQTKNPTKNNWSGFSIWPKKTLGASLTHHKISLIRPKHKGTSEKWVLPSRCCLVKSESYHTAPDITFFPVLYVLMAGCCAATSPPSCPVAPDVMVLIWAAVNPLGTESPVVGLVFTAPSACSQFGLSSLYKTKTFTLLNVNKIQPALREHSAEHALQPIFWWQLELQPVLYRVSLKSSPTILILT